MKHLYSFFLWLLLVACSTPQPRLSTEGRSDQASAPIDITILQLNDVYEISPLEGGTVGGLARVATLLEQLKSENPNTIAVMAGDFLSPSFMGTLKMNGERVAGQQMVETLNAMGLDYATFGNHEFDLSDSMLLRKRLDQSDFKYVCANARWESPMGRRPFIQRGRAVPDYIVHEFKTAHGQAVRLAIIGVVLPFAQQDYLYYEDVTASFQQAAEAASESANIMVGLTHLNLEDDMRLALAVPDLPLFMGGHEHENNSRFVGSTVIAKADANAKTVYIHRLRYYPDCGISHLRSELMPIDGRLAKHPATQAVIDKWAGQQSIMLADLGYDANRVLTTLTSPLEGREVVVRNQQTNYGQLTLAAFQAAWPGAAVYLLNSGSLRIDDKLMGTVTEYDVLRSFPFGGPIVRQEIVGADLIQLLEIGTFTNQGEGGYMQRLGAEKEGDNWVVDGQPIQERLSYSVVMPKFVADGRENNLSFLAGYAQTSEAALMGVKSNDIRDIVIAYMGR